MTVRIGQGFDVHRFTDDPDRPLVLGGVTFPGEPGLEGHSDADVIAHAAADALLGAAGLGDLGQHFPDSDPAWAGADSLRILAASAAMVREAGWEIGNVDVSVVCETPKLAPHRATMERNLSDAGAGTGDGQGTPGRRPRRARTAGGDRLLGGGRRHPPLTATARGTVRRRAPSSTPPPAAATVAAAGASSPETTHAAEGPGRRAGGGPPGGA